jgi:hypothetical protein
MLNQPYNYNQQTCVRVKPGPLYVRAEVAHLFVTAGLRAEVRIIICRAPRRAGLFHRNRWSSLRRAIPYPLRCLPRVVTGVRVPVSGSERGRGPAARTPRPRSGDTHRTTAAAAPRPRAFTRSGPTTTRAAASYSTTVAVSQSQDSRQDEPTNSHGIGRTQRGGTRDQASRHRNGTCPAPGARTCRAARSLPRSADPAAATGTS